MLSRTDGRPAQADGPTDRSRVDRSRGKGQSPATTPYGSTDALSGLAPLLRVRPELESLCRFGAQWASPHEISTGGWARFHLIVQGRCVIEVAGIAPIPVETGDVAVLPHGGAHTMRGATTPASLARTADLRLGHTGAILVKTNVEAEPETELVCGRLLFEQAHQNLILATLPPVIVLRTRQDPDCERLRQLMAAISDELDLARPGAAAISADLASALLVMVLRTQSGARAGPSGPAGAPGPASIGPDARGHARGTGARLDARRARDPRRRVARDLGAPVPEDRRHGAARLPDRAQARPRPAQALGRHHDARRDRGRGGLSVGEHIQPRLPAPLRHAAWRDAPVGSRRLNLVRSTMKSKSQSQPSSACSTLSWNRRA